MGLRRLLFGSTEGESRDLHEQQIKSAKIRAFEKMVKPVMESPGECEHLVDIKDALSTSPRINRHAVSLSREFDISFKEADEITHGALEIAYLLHRDAKHVDHKDLICIGEMPRPGINADLTEEQKDELDMDFVFMPLPHGGRGGKRLKTVGHHASPVGAPDKKRV